MGSQRPNDVNIDEFKIQNLKIQIVKMLNFKISKFQNSKFQNSNLQIFKLHSPASILEYQKHVKLRQKQLHMKDVGKSSSRKLRYVIYQTLYRMDPQKTYQKKSCCANILIIRKLGKKSRSIPPHSPQKGPICPLEGPYLPLSPWTSLACPQVQVRRFGRRFC